MGLRSWRFWATKAETTALNRYESELLSFIARKKELEFDLKNAKNKIDSDRASFEITMNRLQHDFSLEMQGKLAAHQREIARQQVDYEIKLKDLQAVEVHKINKIQADADEKLAMAINQHKMEMLAEREKQMCESYEKLSRSMTKLHEEGNAQTKFVQEMAISLLGQAPKINKLEIGVGQPKDVTEVNVNDNRSQK